MVSMLKRKMRVRVLCLELLGSRHFFFGGDRLDALSTALALYESLLGKDFYITIAKNEDRRTLHLVFKKANFPHLLGITKLNDLTKIVGARTSTLYNKIKRGEITYDYLSASALFTYCDVGRRIAEFPKISQLIQGLQERKVIIKFNPRRAGTMIEADFLIYVEEKPRIICLFIVEDYGSEGMYVPMSFFGTENERYLRNQTVYNVVNVEIVDTPKGKRNISPCL